jgi:hypothetical protein
MPEKGQDKEFRMSKSQEVGSRIGDFVLDKVIFSNVFDKDIRRIYIYRKSERLAKAIQLITPAFANSPSLKNRLDGNSSTKLCARSAFSRASRTLKYSFSSKVWSTSL